MPKYLLWTFHFLRNYLVEDVGHKMWHVPKQTYRDHVWETIDWLAQEMNEVFFHILSFLLKH
jgi:hypothetical protein